jgi:hypothetical protein
MAGRCASLFRARHASLGAALLVGLLLGNLGARMARSGGGGGAAKKSGAGGALVPASTGGAGAVSALPPGARSTRGGASAAVGGAATGGCPVSTSAELVVFFHFARINAWEPLFDDTLRVLDASPLLRECGATL